MNHCHSHANSDVISIILACPKPSVGDCFVSGGRLHFRSIQQLPVLCYFEIILNGIFGMKLFSQFSREENFDLSQ